MCGAFFRQLDHVENMKGCSCGVRIPMKEIIKIEDYISASGKYPERLKHKELTNEIKDNARKLLAAVNQLLEDLKINNVKVSSGWRPSDVNAAIPNAAKKSSHMSGVALDMVDDKDQTMGKLIAARPDLLRKYNLFIEDLGSTKGWVHLDQANRSDRPSRSFKP